VSGVAIVEIGTRDHSAAGWKRLNVSLQSGVEIRQESGLSLILKLVRPCYGMRNCFPGDVGGYCDRNQILGTRHHSSAVNDPGVGLVECQRLRSYPVSRVGGYTAAAMWAAVLLAADLLLSVFWGKLLDL
jgi:hypothetical protein